tara:strand:- start:563 stop:2035 length:1473 start_codon:yes stop_codon:yes gene_type:complete
MTTKLSKLIQLGAKADSLIQLGRYDIEDGDTKMLKDAAIAGGVGVGGFFGGRKLMQIGDKINEKRYNAIVQGGPKVGQAGGAIGIDHLGAAGEASPFVKGIKKLPTAEEFKGSSIRSIGTGLKNVFGRLRKAVRLSAKLDDLINFSLKPGRGARLVSRFADLSHESGKSISPGTLQFLQEHLRSKKMTGLMGRMRGYDGSGSLPGSIAGVRAMSAKLDGIIELARGDYLLKHMARSGGKAYFPMAETGALVGAAQGSLGKYASGMQSIGRDSGQLSGMNNVRDHIAKQVKEARAGGMLRGNATSQIKAPVAPRSTSEEAYGISRRPSTPTAGVLPAGQGSPAIGTDTFRDKRRQMVASMAGRISGMSAAGAASNQFYSARHKHLTELSQKADNLINFDIEDGVIGAGLVGGAGVGATALWQRGARVKVGKKEARELSRGKSGRVSGMSEFIRTGAPGGDPVWGRGIWGNIKKGGQEYLKSGKSALRAALK